MQVLGDGNMQIGCDIKLQMEKAEEIIRVGRVKVTQEFQRWQEGIFQRISFTMNMKQESETTTLNVLNTMNLENVLRFFFI